MHGVWRPIRAELDGTAAPEMALELIELRLGDGRYRFNFGGETTDEGEFTAGFSEGNILLTLTGSEGVNAGKKIPCLARVRGDRLRICFGLNGERPTAFETGPHSGRYLVMYRRE